MSEREEKKIKGIGAATGIGDGKAFVLSRRKAKFSKRYVLEEFVPEEIKRVEDAMDKTKADLQKVKEALVGEDIHEHVDILDSHLMILEDPMLREAVREMIASEKKNAEWALVSAFENYKRMFNTITNDYLRERISDFDYLRTWTLRHLSGRKEEPLLEIEEKVVVIAHYLSPADTAQMDRDKVVGFVTDIGGKTSHTAILARALKIPAVVGAEKATFEINTGDRVILDGRDGVVVVNPNNQSIRQYKERKSQYGTLEKAILKGRDLPAQTLDDRRVTLLANIEIVEEAQSVHEYGAEGIGLYRTEFLCLSQGRIPGEEGLYDAYRSVLEQVAPYPVTIRTFDLGSDKSPGINHLNREMNPALGLRSIRHCLKEIEMFKNQLRAILRASHYGKARILLPMISGLSEFKRAVGIYEECKEDLRGRGQPFDPDIDVGIMIEVPSAALIADVLAKEADFFSIGTNDLIQYCLAVDRINKDVAYLFEPLHPSIVRLLRDVVDAGHKEGIPVGMCGEMAGDLRYIFLLLGFGFDHLSMVSSVVPWIKRIIRSARHSDAEMLAREILKGQDSQENEEILSAWIKDRFPDLEEVVLGAS